MAEAALDYELYARSTSTIRRMGNLAVRRSGEVDLDSGEVAEGYTDFLTAIGENLATDSEFGESLIFYQLRPYRYIGGKTRTADGRPVIDLVRAGARASREAARYDSRMRVQLERDEADVMVAGIVDKLEVGEMYAVTSLDPKSALKSDRKYWEAKGYREGMAVLQVYYRLDEHTMLAGAYSIKKSDKAALSRIWANYGKHLPIHTPDSEWIKYGIRASVDTEDAKEFGKGIIRAHQAEIGDSNAMMSVTEFIDRNKALVQSCFRQYILPLSRSLAMGRSHPVIQELANQILQNGANYSVEDSRSLMRLANGGEIDDRDASVMEEKIRYGVVEELRKLLKGQIQDVRVSLDHGANVYTVPRMHVMEQALFMQNMGQIMAGNIAGGMAAGRSYGGCASAGNSGSEQGNSFLGVDSVLGSEKQDVFSGQASEGCAGPKDKFGPLNFKCPKGHWNKRKPAKSPKDFLTHCTTCKASLKC